MSEHFFKTRTDTQAWLRKMGIKRYSIRKNLTVDVNGSVEIFNKNLASIPVQFGTVSGRFSCQNNQLTSLAGSPASCAIFDCDHNNLTDLTGAPDTCTFFRCDDNQLTSLAGAPRECEKFSCDSNQLIDLGGSGQYNELWCSANQLTSLNGVPGSCKRVCCYENPDLYDISAVPDGCEIVGDLDIVAKNQAARQLAMLNDGSDDGNALLKPKTGRIL